MLYFKKVHYPLCQIIWKVIKAVRKCSGVESAILNMQTENESLIKNMDCILFFIPKIYKHTQCNLQGNNQVVLYWRIIKNQKYLTLKCIQEELIFIEDTNNEKQLMYYTASMTSDHHHEQPYHRLCFHTCTGHKYQKLKIIQTNLVNCIECIDECHVHNQHRIKIDLWWITACLSDKLFRLHCKKCILE